MSVFPFVEVGLFSHAQLLRVHELTLLHENLKLKSAANGYVLGYANELWMQLQVMKEKYACCIDHFKSLFVYLLFVRCSYVCKKDIVSVIFFKL